MLMIRILNLMMIFYDDLKTLARRSLLSLFLLLAAGLGRPPSYGWWWWWWWWLRWRWWSKCYYMMVTTTPMMIITIICPLPPSIIGWAYSVPPTPLLTTSLIVIIIIRKGLKKVLWKVLSFVKSISITWEQHNRLPPGRRLEQEARFGVSPFKEIKYFNCF